MLERAEEAIKEFLENFNYRQTLQVFRSECENKIKEESFSPHIQTKILSKNKKILLLISIIKQKR
jgi:hypothetical protein